jgi:hypothetical protein
VSKKLAASRACFCQNFCGIYLISYETVPLMKKFRGIFPNFARLDAALLKLYLTPLPTVEQPDLTQFFSSLIQLQNDETSLPRSHGSNLSVKPTKSRHIFRVGWKKYTIRNQVIKT